MTAHAMSVLREEMLCLACLVKEEAAIAAYREGGQSVEFAQDPEGNEVAGRSRRDLDVRFPSRTPRAEGALYVQEIRP
jgi:hypothetical protein